MSSEFTHEDSQRLADELARLSPALDSYVKSMMKREAQNNRDAKEDSKSRKRMEERVNTFNNKLWEANQTVGHFSEGVDRALGNLTKAVLSPLGSRAFMGIAVFTALFKAGENLNRTWRDMTEYGQTFGGSMFAMQQAANNAGLPLETFANLQKRHNVTISAMGNNFWAVNKQLRQNLRVSGMYGMSMEQLGDFTGKYMEAARQNGTLQGRSTKDLTKDMQGLALSTTALAKISDKTREQIADLATAATTSALAIGGLRSLPADIRGVVGKSATEIATGFAALPGEAGKYFSSTFGDSLAGMTSLTQGGQLAIDAGLSGLASEFQALSIRVRNGGGRGIDDVIHMNNRTMDMIEQNKKQLTVQALAGNQAAAQMLEMYGKMKRLNKAEYEKAMEQAKKTEAVTAFFASIGEIFAGLKAAFGSGFMKGFKKAFKGIEDLAGSPMWKNIEKTLEAFGERFGTLLGTLLTEANINRMINGFESIVTGMFNFFGAMAAAQPIWDVLSGTMKVLGGIVGAVGSVFSFLNDVVGGGLGKLVGGIIGAVVAFAAIKKLAGGLMGLFGGFLKKKVDINADVVNVNGGDGGGSEGAGGKGRGRGGRIANSRLGRKFRGLRAAASRSRLGNLMRGVGGASGRVGLLGRGLGLGARVAGGLGVGLLGMGLESGADKLSDNGWGKTATGVGMAGKALSYGATGAMLGSFIPGLGTVVGGALGAGMGALSGYMDYSSRNAPAKAPTAPKAAAAASVAATAAMASQYPDPTSSVPQAPATDPNEKLIEEMKALRQAILRGNQQMGAKMDSANRLLSKIEVSTQSL